MLTEATQSDAAAPADAPPPTDAALRAVLTFRRDLVITRSITGHDVGWMVEDRLNNAFFELGDVEYKFISCLDGKTTVADAIHRAFGNDAEAPLTESDVIRLCQWLLQNRLVQQPAGVAAPSTATSLIALLSRYNPFFIRIPVLQPDRLLEWLEPPLRFLFSPMAVVFACCLMVLGTLSIVLDSARFVQTLDGILTPGRSVSLLVCWIVLKIVHEMGHGLVCKRYGGFVREAGAMLILFVPIAYIDVTSSWRFRSKWQRIYTAAAGMYVEGVFAAAAAVAWSLVENPIASQWLANVVLMAGISTILFNANPLMRFDGYYILSDLFGLTSLYTRSSQYIQYVARRYGCGATARSPIEDSPHAAVIRVYAVASTAWRASIVVGLLLAAATMFHGAGIVLVVIGLLLWVVWPLYRIAQFLKRSVGDGEPAQRTRIVLTTCVVSCLMTLFMLVVPWPVTNAAPGVVEYAPLEVVRASTSGFVDQILVEDGEVVTAGTPLVVMNNDELQLEIASLRLEIEKSQQRIRRLRNQQQMAAVDSEQSQRRSLHTQLAERLEQREQLSIVAPADGRVVRRQLPSLLGTYLEEGDVILSLGDEGRKELRISLAQSDVEQLRKRTHSAATARLPGADVIACQLDRITPRATRQAPHESLYAINGGALSIQPSARSNDSESSLRFQLLTPRFDAIATLNEKQSRSLRAGQRCELVLSGGQPSIGTYLWRYAARRLEQSFLDSP